MIRPHSSNDVLALSRIRHAAAAAATVLLVYVVLRIASLLASMALIGWRQQGLFDLSFAFGPQFIAFLWGPLPFSVGVFLSVWLVAPVRAELRVTQVVARSLIAVAFGTVVVFVVQLVGALLSQINGSGVMVFGWMSAALQATGENAGVAANGALYSAVLMGLSLIPLTVLVGVLLWLWARGRSEVNHGATTESEV